MDRIQELKAMPAVQGLANSRSEVDVDVDLRELIDAALETGADRATVLGAEQVVVDERVTMKCKIPPCEWYGRCLMCPPYSPAAAEFRECLKRYHRGVLFQVEAAVQDDLKSLVQSEDQRYFRLLRNDAFIQAKRKTIVPPWLRLHGVSMNLEREALKRGYYLSLGLIAGHCRLCEECDVGAPCKRPHEARPSMEACGIDVVGTAKNVGWRLPFPADPDKFFLTGLVLVV
ncbi:MAG: DUF2284 domain-containing protein [Dehalococcoidia bacterium]